MASLTTASLTAAVADHLRTAIHTGEFAPGERLVERRLAADLGVSHIPVREALTRLSDEGLVTREPRRGARVAALSARGLEEVSSLRILLEQFAAVRLQSRWDGTHEAELRSIVDRMAAAAADGDVQTKTDLDQRFHDRVCELAGHELLAQVAAQLRSRVRAFMHVANVAMARDELTAQARSHDALLDAIAHGDPEGVRAAVAEHITAAGARVDPQSLARAEPDAAR